MCAYWFALSGGWQPPAAAAVQQLHINRTQRWLTVWCGLMAVSDPPICARAVRAAPNISQVLSLTCAPRLLHLLLRRHAGALGDPWELLAFWRYF